MFRARRHRKAGPLPPANIICARALPQGPQIDDLVAALPDRVARAVRAVANELTQAPVLGPLLKVEQRLSREVRDIFGTGVVEGTLAELVEDDGGVRLAALAALSEIADSTTSSAAQRLFVAEAQDAVRFVEAMTRRYTAVLMNPPFGEPVPSTKDYLKAAYPWIPRDSNLLALFVGRGLELSEPSVGTCGAITSRSGMFLTSYQEWRDTVLFGARLAVLADLGFGIMEQALVEAAAYVLSNRRNTGSGVFLRMLKETDRPRSLQEAAQSVRHGKTDSRAFVVDLTELANIPGSPVAYWMEQSVRRLFKDQRPFEGTGGSASKGHDTGDDFRFVRAAWEVDARRIAYSVDETRQARWVFIAKGGSYSPYWSDPHLLVDWAHDGAELKAHPKSYPRNLASNFEPGLTWPRRTNSGFGTRLRPRGSIVVDKGAGIAPLVDTYEVLGWLRSRLVQALIDSMVAAGEEVSSGSLSRSYEIGLVQKLPWVSVPELGAITARMTARRAAEDEYNETSRRFVSPKQPARWFERVLEQLADAREADELVLIGANIDADGRRYLDDEIGRSPASYTEGTDRDDEIANLYEQPIKQVIETLVGSRGGSRSIANLTFVSDRRIEVIAHGLQVSPRSILRVVEERGLVAPGEIEDQAFRLLSYLVGVAFGRWDVRIGRDPELAVVPEDLLAPPARYSPGTLLGEDGVPPMAPPGGYPVAFPPGGYLVDQRGHDWDIEVAVLSAAEALGVSGSRIQDALGQLMKRPALGAFLRGEFFKQHLAMYTMSRRRAPIYWQLQVPSRTWGVWLYAPRLSREMLFAVVREAEQRHRLAVDQIGHLQREAASGGGGRSASALAKELEGEQRLAVELVAFREEAERIANLGWEPDLDDGMVLNAAPLADLFPAWKDALAYRKELRQGRYEWATVARFADRL